MIHVGRAVLGASMTVPTDRYGEPVTGGACAGTEGPIVGDFIYPR